MVIAPLLLLACAPNPDYTDTIRGVQVVAIEPIPAEPTPDEPMVLRTWVADGLGRGVDVLVWICTPVDGHCLESTLPGSTGLPLSFFTRVGRADAMFESTSRWPLFAGLVGELPEIPGTVGGGNLLVWALACPPGVCPLIDQVAVDPLSGSDAWAAAEAMLADPAAWIDDLPRGQSSLALKSVGVYLDPDGPTLVDPRDETARNEAPTLRPSVVDERYTRFVLDDPNSDPVETRSFTTGGIPHESRTREGDLQVFWEPPLALGRDPTRFVVAEDGRGGTAVWCSDPATRCDGTTVTFGTPAWPIGPGDPLPIHDLGFALPDAYQFVVPMSVTTDVPGPPLWVRVLYEGEIVAERTFAAEVPTTCLPSPLLVTAEPPSQVVRGTRCDLPGQTVTVEVVLPDASGSGPVVASMDFVVTGSALVGCDP